jgi:hypothetical protein
MNEHSHDTCLYGITDSNGCMCMLRGSTNLRSVDPNFCRVCGHWLGYMCGESEANDVTE